MFRIIETWLDRDDTICEQKHIRIRSGGQIRWFVELLSDAVAQSMNESSIRLAGGSRREVSPGFQDLTCPVVQAAGWCVDGRSRHDGLERFQYVGVGTLYGRRSIRDTPSA